MEGNGFLKLSFILNQKNIFFLTNFLHSKRRFEENKIPRKKKTLCGNMSNINWIRVQYEFLDKFI